MSKILAVDENGNALRSFPVPTPHITRPASGKVARAPQQWGAQSLQGGTR